MGKEELSGLTASLRAVAKQSRGGKRRAGLPRRLCPLAMTLGVVVAFSFVPKVYAACSSPAGVEGEMMYNTTHKVMQYCNGTDWIAMSGISPGAGGGGTLIGSSTDTNGFTATMLTDAKDAYREGKRVVLSCKYHSGGSEMFFTEVDIISPTSLSMEANTDATFSGYCSGTTCKYFNSGSYHDCTYGWAIWAR